MTENKKEEIRNSEELIMLVRNNNLKGIFKLLSKPIDFDEKTLENYAEDSIFHIAIKNSNIKMFEYLYKSFPNLLNKVVNYKIIIPNNDEIVRKSMLQIFAEMGNIKLVNILLSTDNIDYNQTDLINYLIKGKVNKFKIKEIINEYDIENEIDQKIINAILGIDSEYNNYTIFNYVIDKNDIKGLRFLLKFYKSFEIYAYIINDLKQKGKETMFQNLIDDFVFQSINEKDINGNTLLHYAVLRCDLETIIYLIRKGAKADIENNNKLNPLGILLNSDNYSNPYYTEIVNLLLNNYALSNIRAFELYINAIKNERTERRLGLTEISRDQDVLNAVEDFDNQQQNSEIQQKPQEEKNNIKKQIINSIKSFDNNSNLATLYGQGLIYCMVDHIDNLEYDFKSDPIWKFFNNIDKVIENSEETEKTIEKIYKLIKLYKPEIIKVLKSLNNEDFNVCKTMFSMNKVKEKMNKLSNNLYKEIIGNFIEKTIMDIEYDIYIEKINNLFPNKNNLEIDVDILMELVPFNENNEVNKEKLSNIVDIAENLLPKNKFNESLEVLERNFGYKKPKNINKQPKNINKKPKNINKNFYEGFGDDLLDANSDINSNISNNINLGK